MNTVINQQLEIFRKSHLALLTDDSSASGRTILVAPAANISSSIVNQVLNFSSGLIYVALTPQRAEAFLLSAMTRETGTRASDSGYDFCVSVDARENITTGISADDRAEAVRLLGAVNPVPRALVKPGHIFPVRTRLGGILVKHALPEGALDLVTVAGFTDAAMFAEVLDREGNFLDQEDVSELNRTLQLPAFTLGQLVEHRLTTEQLVYKVAEARLPTQFGGELRSIIYKSSIHAGEHFALVKGEIDPLKPTLTRVQTEHTFLDVFGGANSSRSVINMALQSIAQEEQGIFLYLRLPQADSLTAQVGGSKASTAAISGSAMLREYGLGAQVLRDLGVRKIKLLSSSSLQLLGLDRFGIEIVDQCEVPREEASNE